MVKSLHDLMESFLHIGFTPTISPHVRCSVITGGVLRGCAANFHHVWKEPGIGMCEGTFRVFESESDLRSWMEAESNGKGGDGK